jgi:ribose/xylose/arabinose/galactoside ABC-type transport system permease subunit
MEFFSRMTLGMIMLIIGIILFLVEFKALPHKPQNPQKWDELHSKYFRQIKLSNKLFLLLGLIFISTSVSPPSP